MPRARRSGRRKWPLDQRKRFALLLYEILLERFGSDAPFERLKAALKKQGAKTSESTIRGWLPPLERLKAAPVGSAVRLRDWEALRTPDVVSLVEVSRVVDVSVDHLLGAAVPRRLSDREPLGNPASALLAYVVKDYVRRSERRRRDGLAATVGGRIVNGEPTPEDPDYLEEVAKRRADALARNMPFFAPSRPDWPRVGDVLPDGRIVTNREFNGLQVLEADAKAFLTRVSDRVFAEAEEWEENHKESERETVREHIRALRSHAAEIAMAMTEASPQPTTELDVVKQLLHTSLNPLSQLAQADLLILARTLKAYRERHHAFDKVHDEFMAAGRAAAASSDESLDALDALFGTLPRDEATDSPPAD